MATRNRPYRLGLDLGTHSIGWSMFALDEEQQICGLIRAGVRIFSEGRDPKSRASLAAERRLARSMRRRRDRMLSRKRRLMHALVAAGLMPEDAAARRKLVDQDPYLLRRAALDRALTPGELGRALFHLNQRRGFSSNRRADRGKDDEKGMIAQSAAATRAAMREAGARTFGEWLAGRHDARKTVRARLQGTGREVRYALYATRDMIREEFDAIIAAQRPHHPGLLADAALESIRSAIFWQRPLKPMVPGRCTLDPSQLRAPLALPTVQRFRIYQELNNLRLVSERDLGERQLTVAERDRLAEALLSKQKVSFDGMRRTLRVRDRFNLESDRRAFLQGDATGTQLAKPGLIGESWHAMPLARRDEVVQRLLDTESEEELIAWLAAELGLPEDRAREVANARLVDGYGRLGHATISRILPHLQAGIVQYDEAVVRAGFASHSELGDASVLKRLPYYGERLQRHVMGDSGDPSDPPEKRFGRIANPTVHIALNQLRWIVNGLADRFGPPRQIVVETARELPLGAQGRSELEREQRDNQQRNDSIRARLAELGVPANGENLARFKLWEELNDDPAARCCPYTGRPISIQMLFSAEVEVDHILPFHRTLDDSLANRIVCIRQANRDKGDATPFEAFGPGGSKSAGYDWDGILERAKALKRGRATRFAADAIDRALKGQDFLARQLNDTRYISRIAREYLSAICDARQVSVVPGRLTALLRGKWGLNSILSESGHKDRDDHRHHAIDAAVVGATDRRMLMRVATASERAGQRQVARLIEDMPLPWPAFRHDLAQVVQRIVVSHRPDHSPLKCLHNDTAYGIAEPGEGSASRVVHRKAIANVKPGDLPGIEALDRPLGARLRAALEGRTGKDYALALRAFAEQTGVRRVRVQENLTVIPIRPRSGGDVPYKAYKGDSNFCAEIYRDDRGRWRSNVIATFDAVQRDRVEPGVLQRPGSGVDGQSLVMRLHADDLLAAEREPGKREIYRVATFNANGTISLCAHNEANVDRRNRDPGDTFAYWLASATSLFKARARPVTVEPAGYVIDKGFLP